MPAVVARTSSAPSTNPAPSPPGTATTTTSAATVRVGWPAESWPAGRGQHVDPVAGADQSGCAGVRDPDRCRDQALAEPRDERRADQPDVGDRLAGSDRAGHSAAGDVRRRASSAPEGTASRGSVSETRSPAASVVPASMSRAAASTSTVGGGGGREHLQPDDHRCCGQAGGKQPPVPGRRPPQLAPPVATGRSTAGPWLRELEAGVEPVERVRAARAVRRHRQRRRPRRPTSARSRSTFCAKTSSTASWLTAGPPSTPASWSVTSASEV